MSVCICSPVRPLYNISLPYFSIPDISRTFVIPSTEQSVYGVESPNAPI